MKLALNRLLAANPHVALLLPGAHRVTVPELPGVLLSGDTGPQLRDHLLIVLVNITNDQPDPYLQGALDPAEAMLLLTGVLLPGLHRAARRLTGTGASSLAVQDVEADLIVGLVEAIRAVDVARERIAARLIWAAFRAAHRGVQASRQDQRMTVPLEPWTAETTSPSAAAGEPFLGQDREPAQVLSEAVTRGVLSRSDAQLIEVTRLHDESIDRVAARVGVAVSTLRRRRHRAEQRLRVYLTAR